MGLLLSIKYFCCACGAQALYFLFITTFEYFGHPIQALSTAQSKATFRTFFLGMGFISSSAAIHSMVILEQSIGKRYLHGYNAAKKFMSAKVLVSLAFLQSLVLLMPPFSLLSETRQKLLYASTMCFECFLISIFHLVSSDLRYRHVTSLMVALHVEIKAFVLNSDVLALTVSRRERVSIVITTSPGIKVINELSNVLFAH